MKFLKCLLSIFLIGVLNRFVSGFFIKKSDVVFYEKGFFEGKQKL